MSNTNGASDDQFNRLFSKEFILLSVLNILVVGSHAVNGYITLTIVPSIVIDLGGREYMFWLFALFQVGSIVAGVVAGSFKNQLGSRTIFSIACLILLIGSVAGGTATNLSVVILGRGLQGIGEGMLISLIYILVADLLPHKLLPRMFALSSVVWSVAAALGPLFAGVLDELISWRAAFLFNVPLVLILITLAWRAIPIETEQAEANPLPVKRLVLLTSGLLILGAAGQFSNIVLLVTIIVGSLLMMSGFLWLDNKADNRLLPKRPFSQSTIVSKCLTIMLLAQLAGGVSNVYMASMLRSVWELSALQAGYALALIAFTWTIAAWLTNKIDDPSREIDMIRFGTIVYAIGHCTTATGLYTGSLLITCIGFCLHGVGMGSSSQFNRKAVMVNAEPKERSITSGAMAPTTFAGAVIGAALAGLAAQTFGLFEGDAIGRVFDPEVARVSGTYMLLSFAAISVGATFLSFRLQAPTLSNVAT